MRRRPSRGSCTQVSGVPCTRAAPWRTRRLEIERRPAGRLRGPDLGDPSGVTREALARTQQQYAQLLLEMHEDASYAPMLRGEVVSWRDVAKRLTTGEALVEYLVSDSTTVAFVVTRDTLRTVDLGAGRHELASLVDFVRGTMVRPPPSATRPAWRAPLRRLYEELVAPLQDAGALADVHRLVVVPHAELHYLPYAALVRAGERRG